MEQKKKILFVNAHMRYGGIEKSLLDVLKNLDYKNYEIDLLLIEDKGDYFNEIPDEVNIIFKDLKNAHGPFLESLKQCFKNRDLLAFFVRFVFLGRQFISPKLLKLLQNPLAVNRKYDFAIAYRKGICTELVQYAIKSTKKSTWWHHGAIDLDKAALLEFEKTCVQLKNVVFVSESSEKMLVDVIPLIKNYTTVIPNMIDKQNIIRMSKLFNPNFENEVKHFVTACRFAPEKHLENVIFASELLINKGFSNFKWHIVGDGDQLESLKALSKAKKITEHVIFEGKKENPYPYLKYAAIYIHTSYIESQGLSILEAMTLQTPCILTDNEGIRNYTNENNAVIVKQEVSSLVDAIFDLVSNKEKYDLLTSNTKCPEKFESATIIKKIDLFLSKIE